MDKPIKPGQHVLIALRKMIASGELADGARIAEITTAERLGVSRMPVRTALRALEQEGLVVKLGARGYAARGPTSSQIENAIEVRGVLEGLAARTVASAKITPAFAKQLKACLKTGDELFEKGHLAAGDVERFYDYNMEFHNLLVEASNNQAIAAALSRNNHLPFASAAALALDWNDLVSEYHHLLVAHKQHWKVSAAILSGNADAAELLMREHARAPIATRPI